MVVIKNIKNKAYILWESLVALATFSLITTLFLSTITQARAQQAQLLREQEILNLAKMAVQTKQDILEKNGVQVQVVRSRNSIQVLSQGKEVLRVDKK